MARLLIRHTLTATIVYICSAGTAFIHASDLPQLPSAGEKTIAAKRLEMLCGQLREEVRNPSPPDYNHPGVIDHDYLLVNMARRIGAVLEEDEHLREDFRIKAITESNAEVKEISAIALGLAGDSAMWRTLREIAKRPVRPQLRQYALVAICEAKATLLIPELIELLDDGFENSGVFGPHPYPMRGWAAFTLNKMKVQCEPAKPDRGNYKYTVDKLSAANVIAKSLYSKNEEEAHAALDAIKRVGGAAALMELHKFIHLSKDRPIDRRLIDHAKEAADALARKHSD